MTELRDRLQAALGDRYALQRELGRGGMAAVFLAADVKHDRLVAIKVLPPDLGAVVGAERFLREIRVTAGLRHPHILPLLDSGEADGLLYYVMPYVEGESLRERLARERQLPIEEALAVAREVADALHYAHGRGVIHRDIKPENILLEAGHAVVADFGIARALSAAGGGHLTQTGLAIGTPAYMSPEQASAEPVDARTDVYSLACVLYEMLAGAPPFEGPTAHAILARRLTEQAPDVTAARRAVPAAVGRALATGLAALPADRFSDAHRFAEALSTGGSRSPVAAAPQGPWWPRRWIAVGGVVVVVGVIATVALLARRGVGPDRGDGTPARRTVTQVTVSAGLEQWPAWFPDGQRLVYSAEVDGYLRLVERALDTGADRTLTTGPHDDIQAAVAPGGTQVAFVRSRLPSGKLQPGDILGWYGEGGDIWVLDTDAGTTTPLVRDAFNPAYAPDGARLAFDAQFAGPRRIWTTDARGRNPQQVTTDSSEATVHTAPAWSPDGARIAFRLIDNTKSDIAVVDVATRTVTRITDDNLPDLDPVWSANGEYLYYCSSGGGGLNLWRVSIAPDGASGAAEQLTTGAGNDLQPAVDPATGRVAFTILAINSDLWRLPVSPVTGRPTGEPEALVGTTREDSRGAWSPDGRAVAFNSDRLGDMNIWIHDLATRSDRQLTRGPGGDFQPNWSPDGSVLAFFSARSGTNDIWSVEVATGALTRLTDSPAMETNPFFSPDGRRIAYHSDATGRIEVWVADADGGRARQLSTGGAGGHFMRWSDDGRSVFFRSAAAPADRPIVRVDVEDGSTLSALAGGSHISLSPDRQLLLDVTGHKVLWVYPVDGRPRWRAFEFADPDSRIDYPVWSPDGQWVLFDRGTPRGGDIWVLEEAR